MIFDNTRSDTHTKKKTRLTLYLGNQEWEGRDKQAAIGHFLTCHSVKRLSSIVLLSTSERIFKYRRVLILCREMSDCKSERVNIKFLVKLKKSATETFHLLTEAYREDCMFRARVFNWYKPFSEGRESVKDDRPGRPCTAVTDDIEKVRDVIRKDRRLGVRAVAEEVNLDRGRVRRILREELSMRKVCAKMVPKLLSDEQKERRKELCLDLLQRIENEPDLLNSIITCDETVVFMCDPETRRQSMQWKSTSSPRPKKARMSRSKFKAMLFSDIQGIVMAE